MRRVEKGRWSGPPRWGSRGLEVGSPSRRGMEEENPWGRGRGVRRLSPCRLGKTKRSGEKPSPPPPPSGGHRRRDQWTCAGVPRHHGDLLATSRNKMATLSPSIAERWRQNHVVHLRSVARSNRTSLIGTGRVLLPVEKMIERFTEVSSCDEEEELR